MSEKTAFYAVKNGRHPGIYKTWDACSREVAGFSGAIYKKFKTEAEAAAFMEAGTEKNGDFLLPGISEKKPEEEKRALPPRERLQAEMDEVFGGIDTEAAAFVDGSFCKETGIYGYGVVLLSPDGGKEEFLGGDDEPEMQSMRNISGELLGAMRAVEEAESRGFRSLTICYDYAGIRCWALGEWKTNRQGTAAYAAWMQEAMQRIRIVFRKVAAHTGVYFNERADQLAKRAAGVD